MNKKKLVTLGAGTGQSSVLSALKKYISDFALTAIVCVSDNGGHSGVLRKTLGIPAVGDCRQCLVALATSNDLKKQYEFRDARGSLGNYLLARAIKEQGSLSRALEIVGQKLKAIGTVLPVSDEVVDIAAELEDNTKVIGEWNILERQPRLTIKKLFLEPQVNALAKSINVIKEADYLIVGPGSLRTGIVSCLLAGGIKQAILASQTVIIFVVNLMTHPGQTDSFSTQEHIDEFIHYAGRSPDYVIINNGQVPQSVLDHYQRIGSTPVIGRVTNSTIKVIAGDFIPDHNDWLARQERIGEFKKWTHILVHDGEKLTNTIMEIL